MTKKEMADAIRAMGFLAPRKPRVVHRADKIRDDGAVSALCFETLKPINMKRATWTFSADTVTCRKCRDILAARAVEVAR